MFVLHEHGARVHVNDADGVAAEMWETGLYHYGTGFSTNVKVKGILSYFVLYNRKTVLRIRIRLKLIFCRATLCCRQHFPRLRYSSAAIITRYQCSGSETVSYGSGSLDQYTSLQIGIQWLSCSVAEPEPIITGITKF